MTAVPSRRDVLLGASAAAATGLAGCAGRDDSLSPVVPREGSVDPRESPTATTVGYDVTTLGHGDRGRAVARSVLYETADGTLVLFSEPHLISPRLDADWKAAGVSVTHDWSPHDADDVGRVASRDSGFTRAEEASSTPYRLGVDARETTCRWTFRVRPPTASTVVPAFRSAFEPSTPPTPGDTVVEVTTDARVSNWRVRRDRFVGRVAVAYRPEAFD